jgi:hypothetical protein
MIKNDTHRVAVDTDKLKFAAEVHHSRSCTLVLKRGRGRRRNDHIDCR